MSKADIGPASPVQHGNLGMTLRDYFAAKAMQALIQILPSNDADDEMKAQGFCYGDVDKFVAKCAYDYADAMLVERGKND